MPPGQASNLNDAGNTSSNNEASSSRISNDAPDTNYNPITCSICKNIVSPEPDDTCGICYEAFSSCSLLHPCHHTFDYECISTWLTTLFDSDQWTPAKTTCPFCRSIIDTIERSNPAQSQGIEELFRGSRERAGFQTTPPISIDNRGRDRYLQLLYHRRRAGLTATGIRPYTGGSDDRRSRSPLARRATVRGRYSPDLLFNFDEDEYNYGDVGPSNNDGSERVSGAVQELSEDNVDPDIQEADYTFEDVLEDVGNMELLRVLEREVLENSDESDQSGGENSTTYGAPTNSVHPVPHPLIDASVADPPYVPQYVAPVHSAPSISSPGNTAPNAAQHFVDSSPAQTRAGRVAAERRRAEDQALMYAFVPPTRTSSSSRSVAPNARQIPRRPIPTTPAPTIEEAIYERRRAQVQDIIDQIDRIDRVTSSIQTAPSWPQDPESNARQIPGRPVPTTLPTNVVEAMAIVAERRNNLVQALLDTYTPSAPMPNSSRSTSPRLIPTRSRVATIPAPTIVGRVVSGQRANGELIFTDAPISSVPIHSPTGIMIPTAHQIPRRPVATTTLPLLIPTRPTAGPSTARQQTPAANSIVPNAEANRASVANNVYRVMSERRRTRGREQRDQARGTPDFD